MIRLTNFSYKIRGHLILDKLNLEIPKNSKLLIIGPNGSGKSTLLRILAKAINKKIYNSYKTSFYLSDSFYLPKRYLARSYLLLLARLYDTTFNIDNLISLTGLENKKIKNLSKGNRQKLALLAALISGADIIYLDEALDGLDSKSISIFNDLFLEVEGSVLIVTHYEKLFKDSRYERIYLNEGRIDEA